MNTIALVISMLTSTPSFSAVSAPMPVAECETFTKDGASSTYRVVVCNGTVQGRGKTW